jgi:hypothetical protein
MALLFMPFGTKPRLCKKSASALSSLQSIPLETRRPELIPLVSAMTEDSGRRQSRAETGSVQTIEAPAKAMTTRVFNRLLFMLKRFF